MLLLLGIPDSSVGKEYTCNAGAYIVDGKPSDQWPFDTYADIQPVYTEFKGWNTDLTHCRTEEELPQEFRDYIAFMESFLEVPIKIISVGPDREATIMR